MKRELILVLICLYLILITSFVSASWFGDLWGKITGNPTIPTEFNISDNPFKERFYVSQNNNWISCIEKNNGIIAKYKYERWWGTKTKTKTYNDLCIAKDRLRDYSCDGKKPYYTQEICGEGCDIESGGCVNEEELKSAFLNDSFSQEIFSGKIKYDMSSFNLFCGPGSTARTDEYGYRIINGIRQLGYYEFSGPCGEKLNINNKNNIAIIFLNAYQRDNNLVESDYVDKTLLQKMDIQITASEKRDNLVTTSFVCYNTIKNAPPNEPSKNHRAFLLNLALNVFPEKLRIPKEECVHSQILSVISCDRSDVISDMYWLDYNNKNCNIITTNITHLPYSDYQLVKTMVHEYSHLIDENVACNYGGGWCLDTISFYNISFDIKNKISSTWDFYKLRFDEKDLEKMRMNFFSYAEGWVYSNDPNYHTASEDFAVSVEMYVTNGVVFRDYMKDKPIFIKKYNWIKENVFEGQEFDTGDKNYSSYIPDLSSNGLGGTGIVAAGGITELRPEYKWDYVLDYYN